MMSFDRFFTGFVNRDGFYACMNATAGQERGLLLIGAAVKRHDAEALVFGMCAGGRNSVIISARHRPPCWSQGYTAAILSAITPGGDISDGMRVLHGWGLHIEAEFSQSCLSPIAEVYPPSAFPRIAHFEPNWEAIYSTLLELSYNPHDIVASRTDNGYIGMNDGYVVGLDRRHYKLPATPRTATPAKHPYDDLRTLLDIHERYARG